MSALRNANLERLEGETFDVLVIGAGINGAVSAACLAARGVRVALIDRSDFASFTSQQSSNLAWGGIKYMETMELALVRKLCVSRNHLIKSYPSTVQEIRFLAVHERGFRHGLYKLFLGTLLYWLLGSFFTRRPRLLSVAELPVEEKVVDVSRSDGGFEYSDAYLHDNDARFVWGFVRSALDHGCVAANYVEATALERADDGTWRVDLRNVVDDRPMQVRARVVVNACGPFVDSLNRVAARRSDHRHAFSKGIHLIVRRLTPHKRVLTFFADDGRPFFVVPMGPCSCIGTTDTRVEEPESEVTDEDRRFVLDNVNKRLALADPLTMDDVIAERCGVRPLAVSAGRADGKPIDWMQLSRKHVVEVDTDGRYISIFGGKLTDCLNVGEEVAEEVRTLGVTIPYPEARWYGEPPDEARDEFLLRARLMKLDERTSPRSSEKLSTRLWRRYGWDALRLLEEIRADPSMSEVLIDGAEYLRAEIDLAAQREMIVKLEDFLRRRSKIALVIGREELLRAPGLGEACRILFGQEAPARYAEYFGVRAPPSTHPPVHHASV